MNRELEEEPDNLIYYNSIKKYLLDPKTGLQSTERIYQKLRKEALVNGFSNLSPSRKTIDKIRSSLKTYQVNSATRFTNENIYNTIVATRIGDMFQIDLMDVSRLSTKNNSIHFILTCIDVYSRYVIIEVIKNKTMKNVANAFESIMKKYDEKAKEKSKGINIKNVTSDDGSEFNNKIFKALLNKHGIRQWITKSGTPNKLPIIERFHRTLRHMMNIYFDNYNTMKYTDVLDDIITNYNTSIHRTLKNTPTKIFLKEALYKQKKNVSTYHNLFEVGDTVRKTRNKKVFDKGEKTFSHQLYVITKVNFYSFNLKNKTTGELLDRNFMGYELKKVNYNNGNQKNYQKRNLEREEVDKVATTKRRQKAEPAFNDKNTHQVDDEGNVVITRRHLKPLNEKRVSKKIKLL